MPRQKRLGRHPRHPEEKQVNETREDAGNADLLLGSSDGEDESLAGAVPCSRGERIPLDGLTDFQRVASELQRKRVPARIENDPANA